MVQIGLLEDNTRIARMCVMMLHYAGHKVTVYQHPNECLQALLAQPVNADSRGYSSKVGERPPLPIDVLILDLHLPGMNGVEVVHFLRSYAHTEDLPIIFCSAAPPHEIARALCAISNAAFVEKPFTFQELIGAIDQAIQVCEKK